MGENVCRMRMTNGARMKTNIEALFFVMDERLKR